MSSHVAATAAISDSAQVSGYARLYGYTEVSDRARVSGRAKLYDLTWVYDDAQVYGDTRIYGRSQVAGSGDIADTRHVLTVGPIGREGRHVTIHRHYDGPQSTKWGHLVVAGCWSGTLDALAERIEPNGDHGWDDDIAGRARADYEALIRFARVRVAEWEAAPLTDADHARWADTSTQLVTPSTGTPLLPTKRTETP